MDKPPQLSLGSVHLDIASAFYAGKPEIATTAAALSQALGPAQTLPRIQPSLQSLQSPLMLWPPVIWPTLAAVKHPMPPPPLPPAKKLQVLQTSSVLTPALPDMEALPVVKLPLPKLPVHRSLPKLQVRRPLPKLQMRKPLQQASLVLEQESLKQEMLVTSLTSATSINMMLNSQNPWTETLSRSKDKAPASIKNCMCKNSKCLKLYCGCFATGRYCKDCNCTNCSNNASHENARARQDAINAVLERRNAAFMPKAGSRSCAMQSSENDGSTEDRKAVRCIARKHAVFVQNEQNYALSGILGPSSVLPHTAENDCVISMAASGILHPIRNNGSSQTLVSFPTSVDEDKGLVSEINTNGYSELGPHEVTYRSVLADIVQVEDVNELCKLLILASRQAAEAFLDSGIMENTSTKKLDRAESCMSSTSSDREAVQKELDIHACLPESSSYEPKDTNRPVSPGSQVLLCNELDTVSRLSRTEDAIHSTTTQNLPDIFIEQEKRVLRNFRDYLCKLAYCGRVQGEKLSSVSTKRHQQTSE